MSRFKLAMIIFILFPMILNAGLKEKLHENWRWVKFTTQSGLPSDKNVKVVEAMDGTIWACTPKGFAWYDGYIWHPIKNDKYNFTITEIFSTEPNQSYGLITTYAGELIFINKDGMKLQKITSLEKKMKIFEAVIFNNHTLLLNIQNSIENSSRLYLYSKNRLTKLTNSPVIKNYSNITRHLFRDRVGNIWLNTDKGLYFWFKNEWIIKKVNTINEPFDICKPIINGNGKGYIAIGFPLTTKGIWNLSADTVRMSYTHSYLTSLNDGDMNQQGDVVTVYIGSLIEIYSNGKWEEFNYMPLDMDNPMKVQFTTDGDLWISCQKGFYMCNLHSDRWKYQTYPDYDERNLVNGIIKDDNTLWISSSGGIEHKFLNNDYNYFKDINGIKLIGITGLIKDKDKNIWITSGAFFFGAYRWNGKKWDYIKIGEENPQIHKIKEDRKRNLWFLSLSGKSQSSGFGAFQYINNKFINWDRSKGLLSNRVYDFLEDSKGTYWFATFSGLSRYHKGDWTHWTTNNGLRTNRTFAIASDKSGSIWFTDSYSGVGYIKNDSVHYNKVLDDAEILNANYLAFDDDGKLWISTSSGLHLLNYDAVASFNKNSGLAKSAVWPILFDKDKIYVGTTGGGVNILNLKEKYEPLPKIFLKFLGETDGSIHFAWDVFSYWGQIPPNDIEIRYKIDNGNWSSWNTNREIKYSNLSFGNHVFKIQAKGLFGDYLDTEQKFTFNRHLPFYYSPFFLIPVLIAIGAVFIYRNRYIRKRKESANEIKLLNAELEQRVKERTDQLGQALRELKAEIVIRKQAEEELKLAKNNISKAYYKEKELNVLKSNTFTTISKEFLNPLTIISTSSELLEFYFKENNSSSFSERVNNIKKSVDHLMQVIEEIIIIGQFESNKIEIQYESIDIINALNQLVNHYRTLDRKKHKLFLNTKFNVLFIETDMVLIQHIVSNLLSNALKFSSEGSSIIVDIKENHDNLIIQVKDDGIGIPNDFIDVIYEPFIRANNAVNIPGTGFGLTVVKRSVELLGGEINCISNINEGSVFSVYLPKNKKQI